MAIEETVQTLGEQLVAVLEEPFDSVGVPLHHAGGGSAIGVGESGHFRQAIHGSHDERRGDQDAQDADHAENTRDEEERPVGLERCSSRSARWTTLS